MLRGSIAPWLALALALAPKPRWSSDSSLATEQRKPRLVLFAHPRCPCTRASLAEFRKVLSPFAGKVTAHVP